MNESEIGKDIFDFFSVIKLHASYNLIWYSMLQQSLFYRAWLCIGAVEDEVIWILPCIPLSSKERGWGWSIYIIFNVFSYSACLRSIIAVFYYLYFFAFSVFCPKIFFEGFRIIFDNMVCSCKNIFCWTIILFQLYYECTGIVFLKERIFLISAQRQE